MQYFEHITQRAAGKEAMGLRPAVGTASTRLVDPFDQEVESNNASPGINAPADLSANAPFVLAPASPLNPTKPTEETTADFPRKEVLTSIIERIQDSRPAGQPSSTRFKVDTPAVIAQARPANFNNERLKPGEKNKPVQEAIWTINETQRIEPGTSVGTENRTSPQIQPAASVPSVRPHQEKLNPQPGQPVAARLLPAEQMPPMITKPPPQKEKEPLIHIGKITVELLVPETKPHVIKQVIQQPTQKSADNRRSSLRYGLGQL